MTRGKVRLRIAAAAEGVEAVQGDDDDLLDQIGGPLGVEGLPSCTPYKLPQGPTTELQAGETSHPALETRTLRRVRIEQC